MYSNLNQLSDQQLEDLVKQIRTHKGFETFGESVLDSRMGFSQKSTALDCDLFMGLGSFLEFSAARKNIFVGIVNDCIQYYLTNRLSLSNFADNLVKGMQLTYGKKRRNQSEKSSLINLAKFHDEIFEMVYKNNI